MAQLSNEPNTIPIQPLASGTVLHNTGQTSSLFYAEFDGDMAVEEFTSDTPSSSFQQPFGQSLPDAQPVSYHRLSNPGSRLKPTPARFVHHAGKLDAISSTSLSTMTPTTLHDIHESTLDITDVGSNPSLKARTPLHVGYPPRSETLPPNLVQPPHRFSGHTPVAATVVFSRDAPPLYLPKLDKYLASIPSPSFSKTIPGEQRMFPPMGELSKLKTSLDDLETNARRLPIWKNRTTILGSTVNFVIGVMVGHT